MKNPYKTCSYCSWAYMKPEAKFCVRCGESVDPGLPVTLLDDPNYCTNCGQVTETWARYCDECGRLTYIGKNTSW